MADVAIYSCTGGSLLFFSGPDRRVLRFRPQQQLAFVWAFCCQLTSTLCRAMPRTLQVSCPNRASCGRPQRFGSTLYLRGVSVSCDGALDASLCWVGTLPCGIVSLIRDRAAAAAHGSSLESEAPQRFPRRKPCSPSSTASPLPSTQVVPASR